MTQRSPETTQKGPETTQTGPETTQTRPQTTKRGPDRPESTPVGPGGRPTGRRPGFGPAVPGPSRRRSFDSPQRSLNHSSCQGGQTPPARGVGSLAIRLTRTHRPRIANNGTTNRTKTINFVLPRWIFF